MAKTVKSATMVTMGATVTMATVKNATTMTTGITSTTVMMAKRGQW